MNGEKLKVEGGSGDGGGERSIRATLEAEKRKFTDRWSRWKVYYVEFWMGRWLRKWRRLRVDG